MTVPGAERAVRGGRIVFGDGIVEADMLLRGESVAGFEPWGKPAGPATSTRAACT